jgi:predicted house-cleaning NTP pyrophosphatase (Maf/HAM1 superfamily)
MSRLSRRESETVVPSDVLKELPQLPSNHQKRIHLKELQTLDLIRLCRVHQANGIHSIIVRTLRIPASDRNSHNTWPSPFNASHSWLIIEVAPGPRQAMPRGEVVLLPPDIDERAVAAAIANPTPTVHCSTIARAKLDSLLPKVTTASIILCFDTIVVHCDAILEKPGDETEAVSMVRSWGKKGEEVLVLTAVACAVSSPLKIEESVEIAKIIMTRDLSENEIAKYFEDRDCLSSSGAVIVEHLLQFGAAKVEGDQSVIEGFPITTVKKFIEAVKIDKSD